MDTDLEVSVLLDRFVNVDLFRQGIYYFKIGVSDIKYPLLHEISSQSNTKDVVIDERKGDEQNAAVPLRSLLPPARPEYKDHGLLSGKQLEALKASIETQNNTFATRGFRVQYENQRVRINEGCTFKLTLKKSSPKKNKRLVPSAVFIMIELMFFEYDSAAAKENTPITSKDKFETVDRCVLCVNDPSKNVLAMYPVTFSDKYFCLINVAVQTACVNMRFEKRVEKGKFYGSLKDYLFQNRTTSTEEPTEDEWETLNQHHFSAVAKLIQTYRALRERINHWVERYTLPTAFKEVENVLDFKRSFPYPDVTIPGYMTRESEVEVKTLFRLLKRLHERFTDESKEERSIDSVCQVLKKDISYFTSQVFDIWNTANTLIVLATSELTTDLWSDWREQRIDLWGRFFFQENKQLSDRFIPVKETDSTQTRVAEAVRKKQGDILSILPPAILDTRFMEGGSFHSSAIMFEQNLNGGMFSKSLSKRSNIEPTLLSCEDEEKLPIMKPDGTAVVASSQSEEELAHLFVFVHGYQGNSWDMRMFRNHLAVFTEQHNTLFFVSTKNEGKTNDDIRTLGQTLAGEIIDYMKSMGGPDEFGKISFVTHSLGGVIMREALTHPLLTDHLHKLESFISLAVCHCGYLFGRSKLTASGLWVIRMFNKSGCLDQLSLSDHKNPRHTYMYKLAKRKGLEYFKSILLVSSMEDKYTPYHSARIEIPEGVVKKDEKWGLVYEEIAKSLLSPLDNVKLTRFDISVAKKPGYKISLDSLVGRTAHILLLDKAQYIMQLLYLYPHLFLPDEDQRIRTPRFRASPRS